MDKDLKTALQLQKEIMALNGIMTLLDWDHKTYMPKDAVDDRAWQIQLLQDRAYCLMTSSKLRQAVRKLKRKRRLSKNNRLIVRELDKEIRKLARIPKEFVKALAKEQILASTAWEEAREKDDFSIFLPHLEKMVVLMKQQARYLNPRLKPYDAMLDENEEGMRQARLDKIFERLKVKLTSLLNRIKKSEGYRKHKAMKIDISKEDLVELGNSIIQDMGLNMGSLSVAESAHPFTIRVSTEDVRITTRYEEPIEAIFCTIHEAGHALYEQGLPRRFRDTFLFDTPSMGLHESQSRLWENMIGKDRRFWKKQVRKLDIPLDPFFREINRVRPSFIRVDADEVTYCLHIILRYEIERDMINGKLKPKDAKRRWNRLSRELLGITPKSDNHGILQDVHWSFGAFGYFPSYCIGTIYAAQIFDELRIRDRSMINHNFKRVRQWLLKNIHSKGKTELAETIIKRACGRGLDPDALIRYLERKYGEIYGL